MNTKDYGGLRRIPQPDNLPAAPRGPLKIWADQLEALTNAIVRSSGSRVARYLKRNIPALTTIFWERAGRQRDDGG
jgi:hypothetical protein